jgi:hypothetical protein
MMETDAAGWWQVVHAIICCTRNIHCRLILYLIESVDLMTLISGGAHPCDGQEPPGNGKRTVLELLPAPCSPCHLRLSMFCSVTHLEHCCLVQAATEVLIEQQQETEEAALQAAAGEAIHSSGLSDEEVQQRLAEFEKMMVAAETVNKGFKLEQRLQLTLPSRSSRCQQQQQQKSLEGQGTIQQPPQEAGGGKNVGCSPAGDLQLAAETSTAPVILPTEDGSGASAKASIMV